MKMNIKELIVKQFEDGKLAFKNETQIFIALNTHGNEKKAVRDILKKLEADGVILKDRRGAYATPEQFGAVKGTVQSSERGFAFLIPDKREVGQKDFFIPRHALNNAYDGDRVISLRVKGTADEVQVVKILERGYSVITGVFEKSGGAYYVIPDRARFAQRIFIPKDLTLNAKDGDKVAAMITSYPHGKAPGGKVIEILGEEGDFYAEELSIIRSYGLYKEFPKEVERQAAQVAKEPVTLGERRDLRDEFTITIDGDDTRDIDDAVSLKKQGKNYVLGVHIADVSHYVKRGTKLDEEAYKRGTSVYFPDCVIPMLPRSLSNGACSLNPYEDRYALSCIMTIDKNGKRLSSEICESVICSNYRTTYREITALIDGDKAMQEKYPDLSETALLMKELCLKLKDVRDKNGNIDLSVKEAHIYLDEKDEIVIPDVQRTISENIIEQFMISANEAVAEKMSALKAPFMYRIHEQPSPEKVSAFSSFLQTLGVYSGLNPEECKPKDFQRVVLSVSGKPCENAVNKSLLRTMQKARYSDKNYGHFGLASECYCHFTSPIRRYPDLFIHRIIKGYLRGDEREMKNTYLPVAGDEAAHCSLRERNADLAEREVDDLYKLVYMSDRIGEEYEATISGVTAYGVFAELDNTVEGLIRLERLPGGKYEFLEDIYTLRSTDRSFTLGDRIKIRVDGCDWGNMRPEFGLVE
ncbi:MAG: ribonuclease R [Clostridia bacterium]|nr:ribonuclease R [Clostridia bacterium]